MNRRQSIVRRPHTASVLFILLAATAPSGLVAQIAGGSVAQLRALTASRRPELVRNHQPFVPPAATSPADEGTWESFESPQDVCATAYWYQTLPTVPFLPLPDADYLEII